MAVSLGQGTIRGPLAEGNGAGEGPEEGELA